MQSPKELFIVSLRIVVCIFVIFPALFLQAQNGPGSISGTVLDSAGAVLQGAEIELQENGILLASSITGAFKITNLQPGTYTLKVSYVGFAPFSSEVTVKAGSVSRIDPVLKVASKNEEITVSAERPHGEAEAINRVRTS